ncbi:MAG: Hsp20/alpha crystallin family protein [Saprospiraceae bacterium]|nr:Hsp20/alpha crystallin family protein [Saprospiraceae bacterium]HRG68903.1 Hsp20/alpha crystallin family protein [Saprospiraceae bacterium]
MNSLVPFVQIVDDLISKTFHDINGGQLFRNNTPGLNVVDTGKEFKLELAAPGLNKQDFKIELENNTLIISADKKQEQTENKDSYFRKEFSYHSFKRMFELPAEADAENIKAQYDNGILNIFIPKTIELNKNNKTIEIS